MDLPEITEVQRFTHKPADRYILHIDFTPSEEQAQEIIRRFRAMAQLPEGVPVLIFYPGMQLTIAGGSEFHPEWRACK